LLALRGPALVTDSQWTADAAMRLDKFLAAAERLGSRARASTAAASS
jgi:ribosomal 50S subunit-recycling heat shock protein